MSWRLNIAIALVSLSGCGDSLLGPNALAELDDVEVPLNPGWELRAYLGPNQGFFAPCDLLPAEVQFDDEDTNYLVADFPVLDEPHAWIEGAGFRYAMAVLVLHDSESGVRVATAENSELGVWGMVGWSLALWADGDLSALSDDLRLTQDTPVVMGGQIVESDFAPTGFEEGLPPNLQVVDSFGFDEFDDLLFVDPIDEVPTAMQQVLQGSNANGVVFENCE